MKLIKNLKLKFYFFRQKIYRFFFWNKKRWEMECQRKRAKEMAKPEIKAKVKEYYYKFRFLQDIIERANINDNSKILDIGCGIKTVLHFLPGSLKVGVDPLANEYKKIYSYPSDLLIQKFYGEHIGYPDKCFDVVFISNALDHTDNPRRVISEIWRLLKDNGYLFLANELVEKNTKRDRAHPNNLGEEDILNLLKNKFKIIFKRHSHWEGIREYYLGQYSDDVKSNDKQIVIFAQKEQY